MRDFLSPAPVKPVRRAPEQLGSVEGVVALLTGAASRGLKFPKLWLQFADGLPLRITVAGERSKTPGYLMLTDGEPFGANRFFGRISPAGALQIARDGTARRAELVELLHRLATSPAQVAADYGHLTGHCCFCAVKLSDARSVTVGYGPICAQRFGLAWGA